MADPTVIYLQPACCADEAVGRLWCEDDAPVDCEDGVPWTKYVRADEIERLRAERDWALSKAGITHGVYAELYELRAYRQTVDRFHHMLKDLGLHPGRTDDDIIEIARNEIERLRRKIESLEAGLADLRVEDQPAFIRLRAECDALLLAMQEVHLATIVQEGATAPEHLRLVRNLAQAAIDAARKP